LDTATDKVEDGSDATADDEESGVALLNMVDDNCSKYTTCAYLSAELAQKIQHVLVIQALKNKSKLLKGISYKNDIMAAERIFGPDIGILKGKTV